MGRERLALYVCVCVCVCKLQLFSLILHYSQLMEVRGQRSRKRKQRN